ncbi:unnamed protein product [Ectocarpus sp. CCAP 1310/34]|nr:unnamed protein product [Ectocarpus sp. CCAP 1310/34]
MPVSYHVLPTTPSLAGGADLSGILALDDYDNNDDFDVIAAAAAGKDAVSTTAATALLRASALSFAEDDVAAAAGRNLGGGDGDQLALDAGGESEAWDSEEDDGQGVASPGRAPNSSHGGALAGVTGGTGRFSAIGGSRVAREESRKKPSSSSESSPAELEGDLSSPKRPAEESSDWDGGEAGRSSNDDVSDPRRQLAASDCCEELPWSKVNAERENDDSSPSPGLSPSPSARPTDSELGVGGRSSAAAPIGEEEGGTAVVAGGTITHEHHRKGLLPSSRRRLSTQSDDQAEEPIGVARGGSTLRRTRAHDRSARGTDDETGTQVTFQASGTGAEAGGGDAATIRALRAELSTLREHVLRSEQKREAQLRELGTRLAVQERRSGPERSGSTTSTTLREEGEREGVTAIGTAALVVGEAVETARDKGGCRDTPTGAVVRNPFAGTGGGAATTPRDHFPAFEDALLDPGESEGTPGGSGDEEGGVRCQRGEEGSKSAINNEAFDFSIDTLSHINNHTDFGTDAPLTPAPRSATAAASPKIGRGAAGQARLPWVKGGETSSAQDAGGGRSKRLVREEEEEEEDAAVEEAFFSDACATASLKTPVKHMLATAAPDLGVAVRRGRRPDTGKAASSAATAPTRRKPTAPSRFKVEQQQEGSSRRRSGAGGRPPRGHESPLPDPHSPELCMADVFARASAELDGDGGGVEEEDRSCLPIECGAIVSAGAVTVADPPKGERGSVGVDAGCQTSWSFSARDEIRFVSIPAKPPLSTRMADGRSCRRGAEEGVAAVGTGGLASRPAGKPERAAPGAAVCVPGDDPGPCCTPRQSRLPLCHTPSRRPRLKSDEYLAEGAGPKSGTSSFFDSPNLSPIPAVAHAGLPHSACQNVVVPSGGWRGGGGNGGGGEPLVVSARRRQQQQQVHGLSTILSEGEGSASPGGEKTRQGFDRQAHDGPVAERRASSATGGVGAGDGARGSESSSSRRESPFLAAGVPPVPRAGTAVDRSSGSGPLFMDSFADVTRSSVLRASSTLNTIAPLDDTGPPLSYSSRIGVSFAGELFADSRLRASSGSSRAPRYDACTPPQRAGEQIRAGENCCALPLPHAQQQVSSQRQRRSWSAPTLFSEWSKKHDTEADRVVAPGGAQKENLLGLGGVPPDVVGAWLALAIEGIYSHNDSGGGVTDERIGGSGGSQGRRSCSLGRDPGPAAMPSNGGSQAVLARAGSQVGGAFASGPEDSPPPPPPPPEAQLVSDEDGGANEEEIFYQRQRLLQRVVSAAASHGGVMPPLLSSVRGQHHREHDEQEDAPGGESWRRHSDPLSSWKVPATGSGAVNATETSAAAGTASGWSDSSSGMPAAYMRRHTSGYWRDRLGMTH